MALWQGAKRFLDSAIRQDSGRSLGFRVYTAFKVLELRVEGV